MKILLTSATLNEIKPFMDHFSLTAGSNKVFSNEVYILITGVGVATAFALGRTLSENRFDLAINAGIAGSFNREIPLGEVVNVIEDCFAELGAEDDNKFISIDQLGFGESKVTPQNLSWQNSEQRGVSAITVNKVHGNERSIEKTILQHNPDIESMEGAAFFYACNQVNLPSVQLRAISNYVEKRNRESWNIGLAVKNLNEVLIQLITTLK
jgi:futalosine hydrolase